MVRLGVCKFTNCYQYSNESTKKAESICLKHLVYGTDHGMEWCRDWWSQVNKIKI